jgi:hypothetical protein
MAVNSLPVLGAIKRRAERWKPVYPEDIEGQFHETGYLIFDPGIPAATIDAAAREMLESEPIKGKDWHHGARLMDGWRDGPAIRAIALWPRVLRLLRQMYDREPLPFQTLNFPVGTQQRAHSDAIHFNSDPPGYMCGVWVALEDIDPGNGGLVYYPGSHKLPVVTMEDFAPGPGPKHYKLYEDHIAKMVEERKLPRAQATMKKGQALLWASNLLHGGGTHADKSRTRYSQVTHYFFEGCQYFTPLESYGGYRHLRKRKWIT